MLINIRRLCEFRTKSDCGQFARIILFSMLSAFFLTNVSYAKVRVAVCQILVIDGDLGIARFEANSRRKWPPNW
jgi:hypothetical protein